MKNTLSSLFGVLLMSASLSAFAVPSDEELKAKSPPAERFKAAFEKTSEEAEARVQKLIPQIEALSAEDYKSLLQSRNADIGTLGDVPKRQRSHVLHALGSAVDLSKVIDLKGKEANDFVLALSARKNGYRLAVLMGYVAKLLVAETGGFGVDKARSREIVLKLLEQKDPEETFFLLLTVNTNAIGYKMSKEEALAASLRLAQLSAAPQPLPRKVSPVAGGNTDETSLKARNDITEMLKEGIKGLVEKADKMVKELSPKVTSMSEEEYKTLLGKSFFDTGRLSEVPAESRAEVVHALKSAVSLARRLALSRKDAVDMCLPLAARKNGFRISIVMDLALNRLDNPSNIKGLGLDLGQARELIRKFLAKDDPEAAFLLFVTVGENALAKNLDQNSALEAALQIAELGKMQTPPLTKEEKALFSPIKEWDELRAKDIANSVKDMEKQGAETTAEFKSKSKDEYKKFLGRLSKGIDYGTLGDVPVQDRGRVAYAFAYATEITKLLEFPPEEGAKFAQTIARRTDGIRTAVVFTYGLKKALKPISGESEKGFAMTKAQARTLANRCLARPNPDDPYFKFGMIHMNAIAAGMNAKEAFDAALKLAFR